MRFNFLLLILITTGAVAQPVLSPKEFTNKFYEKAIELHPEFKYTIIEDLHLLVEHEERELKQFLDNAYDQYLADPRDVDNILLNFINLESIFPKLDSPLDIHIIVPVIKDKNYIADLKRNPETRNVELAYMNYNDELIVLFAEDHPKGIRYISPDDFNKTGLSMDSLLSLSVENLSELLPEIQRVGENGSYGIVAGGMYEASLILMTSLWTKENFNVKGDIVIAIPNRDILMINGSKNKKGLEALKKSAKDIYETGSYYLTPALFIWTGEKFVKYNN